MRFLALAALALLAVTPAAAADYRIDMAALRALAEEMPGDKAGEIRAERLGSFEFSWSAVIEGGEEAPVELPIFAFQLVFPDKTALVDVAFDDSVAEKFKLKGWDKASSARLEAAMAKAAFIVVTHEHLDHIGRIVLRAADKDLMARTWLTVEQVSHPEQIEPAKWPEDLLKTYTPLAYEGAKAIAPGVVLVKAPGHTPGSQLVFVKTAAGAEYLFLGDAAWQWRNVAEIKNRSAETVKYMNEDNDAVMAQLAEFNRLSKEEPGLAIVPGHDDPVVKKLIDENRLVLSFN